MTITVDVYDVPPTAVFAIKSSFGLTFPYTEHPEPLTYENVGTGQTETGPALVVTPGDGDQPYSLILLRVYSEVFEAAIFLTPNHEDPGYHHGAFKGVVIPRVKVHSPE